MKKVFVVLSLFLSILLMVACSNQTAQETKQQPKQTVQETKHLEDVLSYFKQKGFTVGEKSEKSYTMISAVDGFGITLNGIEVELYEYDKADNSYLENIKRTGKLGDMNAVVNDRFLLAGGLGKVVQTFKEFK